MCSISQEDLLKNTAVQTNLYIRLASARAARGLLNDRSMDGGVEQRKEKSWRGARQNSWRAPRIYLKKANMR